MQPIEELANQRWDCVVVGTGVGGATLGWALAKAGRKVLFIEKGRAHFLRSDALRGEYPELSLPRIEAASACHAPLLARAGRWYDEIRDGDRRFVPLMGCGAGGSSALYGMAMERFFPADFEPRRNFPEAAGSSLPAAWPIRYADLAPYYRQAEALYRVRGGPDTLRPDRANLLAPPPLDPASAELHAHFQRRGLHPYQLPLASELVAACEYCQGYLCAKGCKNDAGRICLEPAVAEHGAALLDECEVIKVEATRERVTSAFCRSKGRTFNFHGDCFVLAAGALMTPTLLLRSASSDWPTGLANASGQVGHNLMRHCIDLYLVFRGANGESRSKQLALSDFYQSGGGKLGTLQSFGALPPAPMLAADLAKGVHDTKPWLSPLMKLAQPPLRRLLPRLFSRGVLLASIMEDLPYADNRVVPGPPLAIEYRLHPNDAARAIEYRKRIGSALRPYRFLRLNEAENNAMLAHACGTCRFGEDPAASVLDPYNRAHGLNNLFVVDSSFFPSSGGTNPALTIAANALRVADRLLVNPV